MNIVIGSNRRQKEGFSVFIPARFPPKGIFELPASLLIKSAEAERLIGKLDGITHTLPDVDFFLSMFVAKDATSSAQIEGTKATMVDAIEMDAGLGAKGTDAEDILFYIGAVHYGIGRLKDFPLSLRFVREMHKLLMLGARSTHYADPGEFRKSQNWIGGTRPDNAVFVPPPVEEMKLSLGDFEKFLHDDKATLPLIHAALAHAQFETIHPFLDGNGRTGRLLITMLLCWKNMLERPVLFLSSYFKKHQKTYYQKLRGYSDGEVEAWVEFFLDGIIETANESIAISKKITKLREVDMAKIQALAKRESESGVLVMQKLFAKPIVSSRTIMDWTGFSRVGAQKVIERFVKMGILEPKDGKERYDRNYIYRRYVEVFLK